MGLHEPTNPTLGYVAVLIITIGIVYEVDLTIADGRRVHFARLVYTVFYVQGNYVLSGLWIRGVSAIWEVLMYTSNSSSIGT